MTFQPNPIVPGDLFARHQTVSGLRALADFLEANPAVPVDEYGAEFTLFIRRRTDACARAEVDRIANVLGSEICDDTDRGGHYRVTKTFGRITYGVVHVPSRAIADYDARMSYRDNISLDNQATADERAA